MILTVAALFSVFGGDLLSASPAQVAAIEVPFSTHMGEGASGLKRFFRNGCYEVTSEGGTGGGRARDRQAGCHLPREVSEVFQQLDTMASTTGGAMVKEKARSAGEKHDRQSGVAAGVGAEVGAIVIRGDGSRWTASNDDVGGQLLAAINGMPGENQWHAKPAGTPIGKGPQFVAVNVSSSGADGPRRLQASLSVDGRWWCHRSVPAGGGDTAASRAQKLVPISAREAGARLGRVLQGAHPKGANDDDEAQPEAGGVETSVELVLPGRTRTGLFPKRLSTTVAKRFTTEMARQSPTCASY
jgi:hypothetical protein